MDEKSLIHAAQNGDIDAFNQLVLQYQDPAFSQAFWIMKDPDEAEDCVQDAFIKAYQSISTYRGASFRSWLMRIVKNTCLDELRRRKRFVRVSLTPAGEDGEDLDFTDLLVDPALPVEEQVQRSQFRGTLQRYLDELGDLHREVIYLVDVLELDYEEAAQVLGVPVGTVKSRLARGRWHMRSLILGNPDLLQNWDVKVVAGQTPSFHALDCSR
jgi:RNA polymerase sigma-70 factor, ECF subfamily